MRQIRPTVIPHRHRPLQTYQRAIGLLHRQIDPADHRAPSRPHPQAAGYAGEALERPVRGRGDLRKRDGHTSPSQMSSAVPSNAVRLRREGRCRSRRRSASRFSIRNRPNREDMLNDARCGARTANVSAATVSIFRPSMRTMRPDRPTLEAELRRALDRGEMHILFSRSSGSRIAPSPALRRCCAGIIHASAAEPGGIHPRRGGDRQHRRSRPFRHGAHGARAFGLAGGARSRPATLCQRQHLIPAIAASRSVAGCARFSRAGRSPAAR